jgi:hypothetical protein
LIDSFTILSIAHLMPVAHHTTTQQVVPPQTSSTIRKVSVTSWWVTFPVLRYASFPVASFFRQMCVAQALINLQLYENRNAFFFPGPCGQQGDIGGSESAAQASITMMRVFRRQHWRPRRCRLALILAISILAWHAWAEAVRYRSF